MSAPDTDPKKQGRRHRVPLIGMAVVVLLVLALLVVYTVYLADQGNTPGNAAGQVDDFTGQTEQTQTDDLNEAPDLLPAGSDASSLVGEDGTDDSDGNESSSSPGG